MHAHSNAGPQRYVDGRGRGLDKNSTLVYHNRRSRDVHERVRSFHLPSAPELRCTTDHGLVSCYVRGQFLNWRSYFVQSGRRQQSFCIMTEPRYMANWKDAKRDVPWPEPTRGMRLRPVLVRPTRRSRGKVKKGRAA